MKRIMTYCGYFLESIVLLAIVNFVWVTRNTGDTIVWMVMAFVLFLGINLLPDLRRRPVFRLKILADGRVLLIQFLITTVVSLILFLYIISTVGLERSTIWFLVKHVLTAVVLEAILFWNGMIRVYTTSAQLGMKWRVIGICCGMIPVVHLFVLGKIINIVSFEVEMETEKEELNQVRRESSICQTRYPILMVHGVFFRDFRFFQYWGRIPKELVRNGACVYYGNQQSAASVAANGEELAERIREIVAKTGCEKVNIIAHSKGGLDCRYAISKMGVAPLTASLTTINTPHRGCLFADYLLSKIPDKVCRGVALRYNLTLRRLGDGHPDFLKAVNNLTASFCEELNRTVPDVPGVYYQSVGSTMSRPRSGRFPLNMAYPLVKHFDGANDGLVSLESAKWGERFVELNPPAKRGISHGDMIDLNRENIKGFDVREFYVQLVRELKEKGL